MSLDEPTQEEYEDAVIEDTIHCTLCGFPWVLGGYGDGIVVTCLKRPQDPPINGLNQLKLCMDCAALVARTYEQEIARSDICEHGVLCGEWCEPCNRAYREAREDQDN